MNDDLSWYYQKTLQESYARNIDISKMIVMIDNMIFCNKYETFYPKSSRFIVTILQLRKTSSLLHQVKARYNSYEYSSFYKPTTQNKFAFTPSKNVLIIIMNIPRSIRQPRNQWTIGIALYPCQTTRENNLSPLNEMHFHQ